MKTRMICGIGAVSLMALSACGGSSAAPALSKADYTAQANAICKDANAKSNAIPEPTSNAEIGPALSKVVTNISTHLTQLKALKNPADIQGDVDAFLTATGKLVEVATKAAQQFSSGDSAGGQATLQDVATANTTADEAATKIGLTDCATN